MTKVLIIDDDAVRVDAITNFAAMVRGEVEVDYYSSMPDIPGMFHEYDMIFLDHDLGENGGDMSRLLDERIGIFDTVETFEPQPIVIIHSMNPVGAKQVQATLLGDYFFHKRNVEILPFSKILSMGKA